MKEVRYLRKVKRYAKPIYAREYQLENFGKEAGRLPKYVMLGDFGLDNGFGWVVQGFIEGIDGELRQATYEENLFCMGLPHEHRRDHRQDLQFPAQGRRRRGLGLYRSRRHAGCTQHG